MPSAWINQRHALVRLTSRRLQVYGFADPDAEPLVDDATTEADIERATEKGKRILLREIPLLDLERLLIEESVTITADAKAALLRADIPIAILSRNGRYLGGFFPATQPHSHWRLLQYRQTHDNDFLVQQARKIVAAKIYNQRRIVQRLGAGRGIDQSRSLARMKGLLKRIDRAEGIDEMRGLEGSAAAVFYQSWAAFLPPTFPFERRSRRPPHNPVNAVISFVATVIYHEMVGFLFAHGLDPGLGCLHTTSNGRWSLALDLIEPFRPVIAEALTLDLFSRQMLQEDHFEPWNSGIYLTREGRFKLILQYEKRLEREFISEHVGHRTSLRRQMEHQAATFKAALEDGTKFQPFRMN